MFVGVGGWHEHREDDRERGGDAESGRRKSDHEGRTKSCREFCSSLKDAFSFDNFCRKKLLEFMLMADGDEI